MKEEVQKTIENYSKYSPTSKNEDRLVIGCDGRWMTKGHNSNCHAYNVMDLKTKKILSTFIVERPLERNGEIWHHGNYGSNCSSKSMEGYALSETLDKLPKELFERISWFIVDGDLSIKKIITNHPIITDLLNSGAMQIGLDLAHFRKKVKGDLEKLFGKAKKMEGFKERIKNWVLAPIKNGNKEKWLAPKVHNV
jgi:hypothetical protein